MTTSAILKTNAIVLREFPTSNTSRVVIWLSKDYGKITTLIKGSQRPKSYFLGQYDLFYTCELLFYSRERNNIHIAKECAPIKPRTVFRRDWHACAIASYLSQFINIILPADTRQRETFHFLDYLLDYMVDHPVSPAFALWCELKLLESLGLSPRIESCLSCNRPIPPNARQLNFSYKHGGIICRTCLRQSHESELLPLTPDMPAMLAAWQRSRLSTSRHEHALY